MSGSGVVALIPVARRYAVTGGNTKKKELFYKAMKIECLGERPSGNTTVPIYRCPNCGSEFASGATETVYCDKCGAEFDTEGDALSE